MNSTFFDLLKSSIITINWVLEVDRTDQYHNFVLPNLIYNLYKALFLPIMEHFSCIYI